MCGKRFFVVLVNASGMAEKQKEERGWIVSKNGCMSWRNDVKNND